ncbi:MAG TPA: DUF3226 domain-containing protein [Rhodocyclaceae bacterium]|nr:DUF3226 domain-containing protein [Rhodocyclaceae bacterium]
MKSKTLRIDKNKLILVEGVDALYFSIWALNAYGVSDTQVMNFGGVRDLSRFMKTLKNMDSYDSIESIVIARDAETDHRAAFSSVVDILRNNELPAPESPFVYHGASPRVAVMLFPGFDDSGELENGCLEDLCLKTLRDDSLNVARAYIDEIDRRHEKLTHRHKSLLHAYLAAKNKFVSSKLGEAARYGAWDWQSSALTAFRNIVTNA